MWKTLQSLENCRPYSEHRCYLLTWWRKSCVTCWKLQWKTLGKKVVRVLESPWKVLNLISPQNRSQPLYSADWCTDKCILGFMCRGVCVGYRHDCLLSVIWYLENLSLLVVRLTIPWSSVVMSLFFFLMQKRLTDKKAEKATLINKIDVKKNRFFALRVLRLYLWACLL